MGDKFQQCIEIERTVANEITQECAALILNSLLREGIAAAERIESERECVRAIHCVTTEGYLENCTRVQVFIWLPLLNYKECNVGELAIMPVETLCDKLIAPVENDSAWEFVRESPAVVVPAAWKRTQ